MGLYQRPARPLPVRYAGFVAIFAIAPLGFQEIFVNFRLISKPFTPAVLLAHAVLLAPLWTNPAIGQTASRPAAASQPTGTAPASYRSAFEDYKPYTDEKVVNWQEANDNTGRIGGWRAYAKEAAQPVQALQRSEAPPTPTPTNSPAPQPDPHAGHGKP